MKRDRYEITRDMLAVLDRLGPSPKTRIFFGSNLCHGKGAQYLHDLTRASLIDQQGEKYAITERGLQYLTKYSEFERMIVAGAG